MKHLDKNNREIKIGDTVLVPDPLSSDTYNHEFEGTVIDFHDEYVVVEDGEGDCFDIEAERLSVNDEEDLKKLIKTVKVTVTRTYFKTTEIEVSVPINFTGNVLEKYLDNHSNFQQDVENGLADASLNGGEDSFEIE